MGTIRSLHRASIPVLYMSDRAGFAAWSRYHTRAADFPGEALPADSLRQWLESSEIESAVLMPCSDAWLQSVTNLDDDICERFRRWSPNCDVIDTFVDKNKFRNVLETLDLPHPRSYFLARDVEEWRIPDDVFQSAFLKPHDSAAYFARFGVKARFVSDFDDAIHCAQETWASDLDVLLQEYVPGPPTNHYFIDGYRPMDGSATRYLARQRLRMFPLDFGNSTDMVSVPLAVVEPALETLETLFGETGFYGIFSAEFKIDSRDGLFKIIEVNVRPWWYVDFSDRCGLQVCRYAYLDASGMDLPPPEAYKLDKRCIYPIYDWEAFRNSSDHGLRGFVTTLANWLRAYQPVFSWSDPMPALVNFYRLLRKAIARRLFRTSTVSGA